MQYLCIMSNRSAGKRISKCGHEQPNGGFHGHGGTPSYHPNFSRKFHHKPSSYWGTSAMETPQIMQDFPLPGWYLRGSGEMRCEVTSVLLAFPDGAPVVFSAGRTGVTCLRLGCWDLNDGKSKGNPIRDRPGKNQLSLGKRKTCTFRKNWIYLKSFNGGNSNARINHYSTIIQPLF